LPYSNDSIAIIAVNAITFCSLDKVHVLFFCETEENLHFMDWARAIEINRTALARIVAEIFAVLGLVAGGTLDHLPRGLYLAADRLLRPAESALRRLIVIAARGLVVKLRPKRPMPKGLVIVGKGAKAMSFRLFDTRKTFDFIAPENPLFVTVKTYESNPFNPFSSYYQSRPVARDGGPNALHLSRRLAAFAHALETLPRQALRLARWTERRKMLEKPAFTSPLRPGPPPGHRRKPLLEVDLVLRECHGLAWDVLREDTS
jgi:hypothetical protein